MCDYKKKIEKTEKKKNEKTETENLTEISDSLELSIR